MHKITKINLHTHSNVSDGLLSPKDLIKVLFDSGVKICALTDHDKVNGLLEAKREADRLGIQFITGIEISTRSYDLNIDFLNPEVHSFHMLGLGFDLNQLVETYQNKNRLKTEKLRLLFQLLIDKGFKLSSITNLNKKTQIAEALIDSGYANSLDEAFSNIINNYFDKRSDKICITEAVDMIHSAGGRIIWAHPYEILEGNCKKELTENQIESICSKLKSMNVDGIEVYYQKYNQNQISFLNDLKIKYGFIASGGTDYHGKSSQPNTYIEIDIFNVKEVLK